MSQTPDFESIKQVNPYGQEYWSARDLATLLGYSQWRRFEETIQRAIVAYEQSGNTVANHFADVGKMVKLGSGSERHSAKRRLS
jgi:DNA-damage-inducible protein D